MSDIAFASERADPSHDDHFVSMRDVSWGDYLRILREKGDHSAPRIAYLEGQLEIMSPGDTHERIKSMIGCLVETWCLEHDVEFTTVGSWTVKNRAVARAVEPDECYIFGCGRTYERRSMNAYGLCMRHPVPITSSSLSQRCLRRPAMSSRMSSFRA